MVVQDESEAPLEVSVMKTTNVEAKKYVIVKNHVRELSIGDKIEPKHSSALEVALDAESSTNKVETPSKTTKKKHNQRQDEPVSQSDIQELRTVYKQCKAVLSKIEAKYGHLLNLEDGEGSSSSYDQEENSDNKCHCRMNKKIIFDEDGKEVVQEFDEENHVCPKKIKLIDKYYRKSTETRNVQVEYEDQSKGLPDDLQSLANILQDSDITMSYRYKVIDKVKMLKLENLNEIRFHKPALIEKLKSNSNSEELFEFKGANLFSLPGYPEWK